VGLDTGLVPMAEWPMLNAPLNAHPGRRPCRSGLSWGDWSEQAARG